MRAHIKYKCLLLYMLKPIDCDSFSLSLADFVFRCHCDVCVFWHWQCIILDAILSCSCCMDIRAVLKYARARPKCDRIAHVFFLFFCSFFHGFVLFFLSIVGWMCLTRFSTQIHSIRNTHFSSGATRALVLWHGADTPVINGNTKSIQCKFYSSANLTIKRINNAT